MCKEDRKWPREPRGVIPLKIYISNYFFFLLNFQAYALCVLDYDFQILDNAFLVHKPGIKVLKKDTKRAMLAAKTNQLIKKIIWPELQVMYGVKKGCAV